MKRYGFHQSVWAWARSTANPVLHVCCWGLDGQQISIVCCSSGVRRANAGSVTLSAYVGSETHTCLLLLPLTSRQITVEYPFKGINYKVYQQRNWQWRSLSLSTVLTAGGYWLRAVSFYYEFVVTCRWLWFDVVIGHNTPNKQYAITCYCQPICCRRLSTIYSTDYKTIDVWWRGMELNKTRSSAIAEGPRDASCQLKSCQLPRNSA